MSAKWRRVKAWDQKNLTGGLAPLRWILTSFSSVTQAVILLVLIALYGALASIPIGLWAMIPTKLFEGFTLVLMVALNVAAAEWILGAAIKGRTTREWTFAMRLVIGLLIALVAARLWYFAIWPMIRYEPAIAATGAPAHGVRFFAAFVDQYKGTVLRQLPSWEMSEIEFYAWWPFKTILIIFVLNMVTATIRRIEFTFLNIGVLTVHTGIVLISLGSIFYQRGKVEGDIRLVRNQPPKNVFYDAIIPAVYAWRRDDPQGRLFVQQLQGLSRYNDATAGTPYAPNVAMHAQKEFGEIFPPSVKIDVVGVIPYGVQQPTWVDGGSQVNPSIKVHLDVDAPDGRSHQWDQRLIGGMMQDHSIGAAHLPGLTMEHLVRPSAARMADLSAAFPGEGDHAMIVRVPGSNFEQVFLIQPGTVIGVGDTGWKIEIQKIEAADEGLALVSTGYRGAASSRANVKVTAPDGHTFNRSVLHQYPELTQDFLPGPSGQPPRRVAPDASIELVYLDAGQTYLWIMQEDPATPAFRVIQRVPGGQRQEFRVGDGDSIVGELEGTKMRFSFNDFWANTTQRLDVVSVPAVEQERAARGTFFRAFLDVEVSVVRADGTKTTLQRWLPFNQYLDRDYEFLRTENVDLPEVGRISLAFGRLRRELPGFGLALKDFKMVPYPGTETPRDYMSTVQIFFLDEDQPVQEHITQLNHPYIYRRPFEWADQRNFAFNSLGWIGSKIVPEQYKFSQAGWDPMKQNFTVLGVGNNPGIYVIAFGAILIGLGIPWAFYVKPAIIRRRKRIIQDQLDKGEYIPPARRPAPERSNELVGANA